MGAGLSKDVENQTVQTKCDKCCGGSSCVFSVGGTSSRKLRKQIDRLEADLEKLEGKYAQKKNLMEAKVNELTERSTFHPSQPPKSEDKAPV